MQRFITRKKTTMAAKIRIFSCAAIILGSLPIFGENGGEKQIMEASPVRELAPDYVVVGRSPNPKKIPTFSPSIIRGFGKRLIAAYEYGKLGNNKNAHILTSDDGGKTWTERANEKMVHGRLFKSGKSVYYIGNFGDLRIMRSDDNGSTWSQAAILKGSGGKELYWNDKSNVWKDKGNIYLAIMHRTENRLMPMTWTPCELAPVVMRAKEDSDLTKAENWTFSNEICFADLLPGFRENQFPWEYFGIPFYEQKYPGRNLVSVKRDKSGKMIDYKEFSPIGTLEPNIVRISDPDHYWFDPEKKTLHILARCNSGTVNYANLFKVSENGDGTITVGLESVPSGKKCLFLPVPGGQMYFHILYDKETKLFWMLGSQATYSMTRPDRLKPRVNGLPCEQRQRMVLHFSKNLVDWCFAGLVTKSDKPYESRHYASFDIDGDDLIILSRSGDEDAANAHDGNIITFHRVKNFRDLVY